MSAEPTTAPNEVEVILESKSTIRKLGFAVFMSITLAVAKILADAFPAIAAALTPMLPGWAQAMVVPVALAIQAALLKWAQSSHKTAVEVARELPPTGDSRFYK